jgi:hypothetical protein
MATHWGISAAFFIVAFVVYAYVFWLPYRGVNLEQCPAACTQNSDCWVPGCSPQTECNSGRCRLSTGHKVFFSVSLGVIIAAVLVASSVLGVGWMLACRV